MAAERAARPAARVEQRRLPGEIGPWVGPHPPERFHGWPEPHVIWMDQATGGKFGVIVPVRMCKVRPRGEQITLPQRCDVVGAASR